MKTFTKIIFKINEKGSLIGGICLVAMMALIVSNIIFRLTGHVVTGSYELSELLIVVTASFAMGYAAIHETHVDVDIFVSKLSARWRSILSAFTSALSLITWTLTAWAGYLILTQRGLTEETEMLLVPYLPFRAILVFGLALMALIYLIKMLTAAKKGDTK